LNLERIFEPREYNDEKSFKFTILKMKGYTSLSYENLKENRAREAKSQIKTWSRFKHVNKRFLPSSYKQELYLKIISLR